MLGGKTSKLDAYKILICVQNYTTESSFHLHKILDSVYKYLRIYFLEKA